LWRNDGSRSIRYPRDPDDEPFINLALVSEARYLVSRDKDLLDLAGDEGFQGSYPGLKILDPPALLRELAGSLDRGPEGVE
jgi:predicted nucleic acid-binding protein